MNLRYGDEHEKNNELVQTKTNSGGMSSFEFVVFVANFFHTRAQSVEALAKAQFDRKTGFTG